MSPEELLKDEEFVDRIREAKSLAEVVELFGSKGIEVTEAELKSALDDQEGELTEDNLEGVAGGKSLKEWLDYFRHIIRPLGGPVYPRKK